VADETTIRPALTDEEWAKRGKKDGVGGYVAIHEGGYVVGVGDDSGDMATVGSHLRHALAALALYNQPFGFTQEGLDALERCATYALIDEGVCPVCRAETTGCKPSNPPILLPCGHRPRLGAPNADDAIDALREIAKLAALLPPPS
jgi:hypothetical protein